MRGRATGVHSFLECALQQKRSKWGAEKVLPVSWFLQTGAISPKKCGTSSGIDSNIYIIFISFSFIKILLLFFSFPRMLSRGKPSFVQRHAKPVQGDDHESNSAVLVCLHVKKLLLSCRYAISSFKYGAAVKCAQKRDRWHIVFV